MVEIAKSRSKKSLYMQKSLPRRRSSGFIQELEEENGESVTEPPFMKLSFDEIGKLDFSVPEIELTFANEAEVRSKIYDELANRREEKKFAIGKIKAQLTNLKCEEVVKRFAKNIAPTNLSLSTASSFKTLEDFMMLASAAAAPSPPSLTARVRPNANPKPKTNGFLTQIFSPSYFTTHASLITSKSLSKVKVIVRAVEIINGMHKYSLTAFFPADKISYKSGLLSTFCRPTHLHIVNACKAAGITDNIPREFNKNRAITAANSEQHCAKIQAFLDDIVEYLDNKVISIFFSVLHNQTKVVKVDISVNHLSSGIRGMELEMGGVEGGGEDDELQQVSERTSGNGYSHPHPLLN